MKILFVIDCLYGGGAQRVVTLWADILCKSGHDCTVLTFHKTKKEYDLNEKVIRKNFYDSIEDIPAGKLKTGKALIRKIRAELESVKYDLVIPLLYKPCIYTSIANKKTGYKVLHAVRNNPWKEPSKSLVRFIRDRYVKKDGYVILQNIEQVDYFKRFKKVQTFVVNNPISNDCLNYPDHKIDSIKKIVMVGRIVEQKNYDMLLNVANELNRKKIDVVFNVYGDGHLKERYINRVKELGLDNKIYFHGNYPNIYEKMLENDMFIMTSYYEGFPNSLMEAMALQMPVISTNCLTGPRTLIDDGKNGFLVDVDDYKKMAEKIDYLVKNVDNANNMASEAKRKVIENYTMTNVEKQLLDMIDQLTK